jgi:hypothetical protein
MRRVLASLLAAIMLGAVLVVPATARTAPSFSITFCSFAPGPYTGYAVYTVPWANEFPDSTKDLLMTVTLKGGKVSETLPTRDFTAPVPDNVYTNLLMPPLPSGTDWSSFTTVVVKTTGAFRDSATVRQPAGGWPTC